MPGIGGKPVRRPQGGSECYCGAEQERMTAASNALSSPVETHTYRRIAIVFALLGSVEHAFAYQSIDSMVVGAVAYVFGAVILLLPTVGGEAERNVYRLTFSVCWLMAGIAALYANILDDEVQLYGDAAAFYALASDTARGLSITDIEDLTTGAGAVVIWRELYIFFEALGFEKAPYLGIMANVWLVSMAAVFGIKTCKVVVGNDYQKLARFSLLFSLCGLFWLFAALHLRDALGFFVVSVLLLFWTRYLKQPTLINLVSVLVGSVVGALIFYYIRREFSYIPAIMLMAAIPSILLFGTDIRGITKASLVIACLASITLVAYLYQDYNITVFERISDRYLSYSEFSQDESSSTSLGLKFIVKAPFLLRPLLGLGYLFVFPIPIWSGFTSESAYFLFKSANGLFFYGFIPLLALALLRMSQMSSLRSGASIFLIVFGMSMAFLVAATSLETRHFGPFILPLLIIAVIPDLGLRRERLAYQYFFKCFLLVICFLHIAWAFLKLFYS
jgi:hypothetical protein